MNGELPRLLLGLAALGYRGLITERALSSLVAHAKDHGVETVLSWVEDDPGLLFLPSWQFWPPSLATLWQRDAEVPRPRTRPVMVCMSPTPEDGVAN